MKRRKYGIYCSAINCHNCRGKNPDRSFFRFPRDASLCKKWLINSRRQDLLKKDVSYLSSNCAICSDHFEDSCFLNFLKNRLKPDAFPTIFNVPNPPEQIESKRRKLIRKEAPSPIEQQNNEPDVETPSCSKQRNNEPDVDTPSCSEQRNNEPDVETPSCSELCNNEPDVENNAKDICEIPVFADDIVDEQTPAFADEQDLYSFIIRCCNDKGVQTDPTLSNKSPRKTTMRRSLHKLRTKVCAMKKHSKPCRKMNLTTGLSKEEVIQGAKKYLPKIAHSFFASQIKHSGYKSKGRRYDLEAQKLLVGLYWHGPKAYRFLSKYFILPHASTLSRWLSPFINSGPEVRKQIFNLLKLKVPQMTDKEKLCILTMDEIALKPSLFYDRKSDKIIGVEDYGNCIRTSKIANTALTFMIRGIMTKWKQPVAYVLSSGPCNGARAQTLLLNILENLSDAGLNVLGVTSDQGSNFVQLYSRLGVTVDRPYFEHLNQKYFVIFDSPHLIKSFRNNLFKYDAKFNDKVASWQDIRTIYEMDSKKRFRCLPKFTDKHVNLPPFAKMKVSLATQVLSSTCAAALETYVSVGSMMPKAIGTAELCHKLDEIFDCLNSSNFQDPKKSRRGMTSSSCHTEVITSFLAWLSDVHFIDKTTGNDVTSRIKCIDGFKITCKSVLMLWDILKEEHDAQYLLTRRLNQDVLENFFSEIRSKNGCNTNPTPVQFCRSFKQISFHVLLSMQGSNANCTPDDDVLLFSRAKQVCMNLSSDETNNLDESSIYANKKDQDQESFLPSVNLNQSKTITEDNVFYYVCGYLCKKCLDVHSCTQCSSLSGKQSLENQEQLYTYFKQYDSCNIIFPSITFVNCIKKLEETFLNFASCSVFQKKIGSVMFSAMSDIPFSDVPACFPKEFLIKIFIRVRLYFTLKFFNKSLLKNANGKLKFFYLPKMQPLIG